MSILVGKNTRVVVQGITGGAGSFHAKQMLEYGTQVVAGCTPTRGGEKFEGAADAADFYARLAAHWKKHYAGWTAQVLTPEPKLPGLMRLKESRRTPLWNGAIECRLFRFDITALASRDGASAS